MLDATRRIMPDKIAPKERRSPHQLLLSVGEGTYEWLVPGYCGNLSHSQSDERLTIDSLRSIASCSETETVESTVTLKELLLPKRSCSGCLWFYTSCPSLFVLGPFEETPCDNLTPFLFRIVGFRSLQFKYQQTLDTQGLFIGDTWQFVHTFLTSVELKFYLVEGIESTICINLP